VTYMTLSQNGISIRSAVFTQLNRIPHSDTDRQTDRTVCDML